MFFIEPAKLLFTLYVNVMYLIKPNHIVSGGFFIGYLQRDLKWNRCLVKWLQWIIITLCSQHTSEDFYLIVLNMSAVLRSKSELAFLLWNRFKSTCKSTSSLRKRSDGLVPSLCRDVPSVYFQLMSLVWISVALLADLWGRASRIWTRPAGAFDLRPSSSGQHKEKALIYVLFFTVRPCGRSPHLSQSAEQEVIL